MDNLAASVTPNSKAGDIFINKRMIPLPLLINVFYKFYLYNQKIEMFHD